MRTNLIMHFHCSECGGVLDLVYEKDAKANPERYGGFAGDRHTEEPTGAACCYVPAVFVEPCRLCIEKYTGPAKKLISAINSMKEVANV